MIPEPDDDDGDAIVVADDEAIIYLFIFSQKQITETERESIGVVEICTLSTEFLGEDRDRERECCRVVAAMRGRR